MGDGDQLDTPPPEDYPQTYWVSFASAAGPQDCPVEGCKGMAASRFSLFIVDQFIHKTRICKLLLGVDSYEKDNNEVHTKTSKLSLS